MHYSNFIKSKVEAPKLDTAVVIGGVPSTYTTTITTTIPEPMSEAASDIKELAEYNDTMKKTLDDDNHSEIAGTADTAAIILENIKSKLRQGPGEYPDVDPDNVEIPGDTETAGDIKTVIETTYTTEDDSQSNHTAEVAATIDTDDYVSKIIENGSNRRAVSSVHFEEVPDNENAANPFNNVTELTETTPASEPETKTEDKPAKEHPLVALFKNPEDIYRITTVLEHAKALAEAENPANGSVNLSQEEMEFVMGLLMDLGEKYFPDIPLVNTPDYWFIANIPVEMYNAILSWYNQTDVPDILNPVVTLYISMCEEPELAYGRYLYILNSYIYDHTILVNKLNAEYKQAKHIDTDNEEDTAEDVLIETDYDEESDE